jgi:YggT family protein
LENIIGLAVWLIHEVLGLLLILIVLNVILSWLVSFEVINLRNRFAYSIYRGLNASTDWLLKPLRRIIPPIGGLDITPLIPLLLIQGIQMWLTGPYLAAHPPGVPF